MKRPPSNDTIQDTRQYPRVSMDRQTSHTHNFMNMCAMKVNLSSLRSGERDLHDYDTNSVIRGPRNESCSNRASATFCKSPPELHFLVVEMNSSDFNDKTTKRIVIKLSIN